MPVRGVDLRKRAEDLLATGRRVPIPWQDAVDVERMIHELEVHQVELDLQREQLEAAEDRYRDRYDFAPVALLTIDPRTRILDANRTARDLLGLVGLRNERVPLARFLGEVDADRLQLQLRHSGVRVQLEVELRTELGVRIPAVIVLSPAADPPGAVRAALIDRRIPNAPTLAPMVRRRRVLVVDPYTGGRVALCDTLAEMGHDVVAARNAHEAAEIAASEPIDLVIADHSPPWVDGAKIVGAVRAARPEVPALLASMVITEAPTLRSCRVIAKPVSLEALAAALER